MRTHRTNVVKQPTSPPLGDRPTLRVSATLRALVMAQASSEATKIVHSNQGGVNQRSNHCDGIAPRLSAPANLGATTMRIFTAAVFLVFLGSSAMARIDVGGNSKG